VTAELLVIYGVAYGATHCSQSLCAVWHWHRTSTALILHVHKDADEEL